MQIGGIYTIDFAKTSKTNRFSVNIKNGESKRVINLVLLENSKVLDLNNYIVTVAARNKNIKIFNKVSVINPVLGECQIEVTPNMLTLNTDIECEIILYGTDKSIFKSTSFIINKLESVLSEKEIVSSNEFTALSDALIKAKTIDDKANKNEVRFLRDDICLKDLGQDVKEALTGKSVAVVGTNMIGFETLNNSMKYNLGEPIKLDVEIQNGYRDASSGNFVQNQNFKCIYIECSIGQKYQIDTNVTTSSLAIVNFYSNEGTLISTIGKGQIGEYINYDVDIPKDVHYMSITASSSFDISLRKYEPVDVSNLNKTSKDAFLYLDKIKPQFLDFVKLDAEIQNGYRDASSGNFVPHDNYRCIYIPCLEGEKYICDTQVSDASVAIVNFYSDDNILQSYIGKGETGDHKNYEFTVPKGIKYLSITSKQIDPRLFKYSLDVNAIKNLKHDIQILDSKIPENIQLPKMYANRTKSKDMNLIFKYNKDCDLMFRIYPSGPNKLPQLGTFLKRQNSSDLISSLDGFNENFCVISTDMIGPYRGLNAKQNIDGDSPSDSDVWVGGYHGYKGSTSTDVPVATNVSFDLYIDNILIDPLDTNLKPVFNNAKLVVINRIQGCNTMKLDGSGRNILEEKITYIFKNLNEIEVNVEIKALENLSINYYYGLQGTLNYYNDSILFENDTVNTSYVSTDFSNNLYSGNKQISDCYSFKAIKSNDVMHIELDSTFGLGRLRYNNDRHICNVTTAKKIYFNLITSKLDLNENSILNWRGKYKFYSETKLK